MRFFGVFASSHPFITAVFFLSVSGFAAYGVFSGIGAEEEATGISHGEGQLAALPLYETETLWQNIEGVEEMTATTSDMENASGEDTTASNSAANETDEENEESPSTLASFVTQTVQKIVGCPTAYTPVCGRDGVTYKNSCVATEAGAWVASVGECAVTVPATSSSQNETAPAPADSSGAGQGEQQQQEETPLTGAYPDFIVNKISHFGAVLFEGNPLSFSATVKNQGTERAFERSHTGLYLDIGNNEVFELSFTPQEVHALEKNEELQLVWKNAWTQTPGTHTVAACADSAKVIQESLEKNNCETLEFTVLGKAENADLSVATISAAPNPMIVGARAIFSAKVRNDGTRVARSPWFKLWVDGGVLSNSQLTPNEENGYDSDLNPSEEDTIVWNGAWIAKAGDHTYKVCADSKDDIQEVNETDNCREGTFTVSAN